MSVLDAEGFDSAISRLAEAHYDLIWTRREQELSKLLAEVDQIDLEAMKENSPEDLASEIFSIQQGLISTSAEVSSVNALYSLEQGAFAKLSYADSREMFSLLDSPEEWEEDALFQQAQETTAGDFMLERDVALAERVALGIARRLLKSKKNASGPNLENFLNKATKEKAKQVFENAWGSSNTGNYTTLASCSWLGRARSFGSLASLFYGGKQRARIVAEIDNRTTHICRLLHGKEILVDTMLSQIQETPEPASTSSWIIETRGPIDAKETDDTRPYLYLPAKDGSPTLLAIRSEAHLEVANDEEFDMGSYQQAFTDEELAEKLGPPPYHLLCRSIIVPADWPDDTGFEAEVTVTREPK